jgi:hypothetical protein
MKMPRAMLVFTMPLLAALPACSAESEPEGVVKILPSKIAAAEPRAGATVLLPKAAPVPHRDAGETMIRGDHGQDVVDTWMGQHGGQGGSTLVLRRNEEPGAQYPYKADLNMTTQLALASGSYEAYAVHDRLVIIQGDANFIFNLEKNFRGGGRDCLVESAGEYFCL